MPDKDPFDPKFLMEADPRGGFCVTATVAGKEKTFAAEATEPEGWTIREAGEQVAAMLDALTEISGTTYDIDNRLSVARDALEKNHDTDMTVFKILKDLNAGTGLYVDPEPNPPRTRPRVWDDFSGLHDDEHKTILTDDCELEQMLSARGALVATVLSWKDMPNDKCTRAVHRFTEMAAARGAGGAASAIYAKLERMDTRTAADYIRELYDTGKINNNDILTIIAG